MFDYSFQWRPALRALPDMLAGAWRITVSTRAISTPKIIDSAAV